MFQPRGPEIRKGGVIERPGEVETDHFGTERGGNRLHLEMTIGCQ